MIFMNKALPAFLLTASIGLASASNISRSHLRRLAHHHEDKDTVGILNGAPPIIGDDGGYPHQDNQIPPMDTLSAHAAGGFDDHSYHHGGEAPPLPYSIPLGDDLVLLGNSEQAAHDAINDYETMKLNPTVKGMLDINMDGVVSYTEFAVAEPSVCLIDVAAQRETQLSQFAEDFIEFLFNAIDADGSGLVSKEELRTGAGSQLLTSGGEDVDELQAVFFAIGDLNRDDHISLEEYYEFGNNCRLSYEHATNPLRTRYEPAMFHTRNQRIIYVEKRYFSIPMLFL